MNEWSFNPPQNLLLYHFMNLFNSQACDRQLQVSCAQQTEEFGREAPLSLCDFCSWLLWTLSNAQTPKLCWTHLVVFLIYGRMGTPALWWLITWSRGGETNKARACTHTHTHVHTRVCTHTHTHTVVTYKTCISKTVCLSWSKKSTSLFAVFSVRFWICQVSTSWQFSHYVK